MRNEYFEMEFDDVPPKPIVIGNDPIERWMIKSNLQTIREGTDAADLVALLRSNGYFRVAAAVERIANEIPSKE